MRKKLHGVVPPMITVWKEDGSIDEEATRAHASFLIENGCHGVAPGGSTGEFISMTLEERKRVAEIVVDEVAGRVPVYVGTGHYSTELTIELSRHAEKCGADGVMVILPYYMIPPKKAAMQHFRDLKKAIGLPIMLYNNPWFAGYEFTSWEVAELVNEGVLSSIKVAHGDASRVHDLKYLCGDMLAVMYGHDYAAVEGLLCGADGWVSGLPNVVPKQACELYDACVAKDVSLALRIWNKILPLVQFSMYAKDPDGSPHWLSIIKDALAMRGRKVGIPRKPLMPLTESQKKKLREALELAIS